MALELDDIDEAGAQRDENGELVAKEKEIEWEDNTETLRVKPFVTGMGNKLAKHEQGLRELEPNAVAAIISVMCPDLEDIRAEHVEDLPVPKLKAIIDAISEETPDDVDMGGEGNP